jgi:hypothetical protein
MINGLTALEQLHAKSTDILQLFDDLSEKDIRKKHLEILSSEIAVSLINLRINIRFSETSKTEFEDFFNSDPQQIENYIHNFIQNVNESIIDAALFQTELILRFYYSQLTGKTPGQERNLHKIVATLFEDTENNWVKEETKLIILFWTLRNTIHTGGIYFNKTEGCSLTYKGQEYKFEYGKAPEFLKDDYSITMLSDLLDALKYLFESDLVKNLGSFDHPSYYALGY